MDIVYKGVNVRGFDYYGNKLYSPIVYYFNKDMQEIGYSVEGQKIDTSTKGRKWHKSIIDQYEVTRVF